MVDNLCQRWGCRPSEVLAEPVDSLAIVAIVAAGQKDAD